MSATQPVTSNRFFRWKNVKDSSKSTQRLNRVLSHDDYRIPTKFSPSSKDRSESIDKVFNNSRTHLHSSLEITALNRTRQEEVLQFQKLSKQDSKSPLDLQLQKKTSNMFIGPSYLGSKIPTQIERPRSSQLVADLRKQYLSFKKNILQELERQRELIEKAIKEILFTVEVEFQKMNRDIDTKQVSERIVDSSKSSEVAKSLEQMKKNFKDVSATAKSTQKLPSNLPNGSKKPSQQQSKLRQQTLPAPKPLINFQAFLSNIDCLKKRITEMDDIFKDQGGTSKKPQVQC